MTEGHLNDINNLLGLKGLRSIEVLEEKDVVIKVQAKEEEAHSPLWSSKAGGGGGSPNRHLLPTTIRRATPILKSDENHQGRINTSESMTLTALRKPKKR